MNKHLSVLLLIVFLAGCQSATLEPASAPAAIKTKTPAATQPPKTPPPVYTLTATAQPPLTAHEWTPSPVLLRLDLTAEQNAVLNPAPPPQFMLYADGRAFITRPAIEGYPHGAQQILFKQMERAEACRILNALDQSGFLDYDPQGYQFIGGAPNTTGTADAYLEVNAWKSHRRKYSQLPFYIYEELTGVLTAELLHANAEADSRKGFPVISSALRDAYYLTSDYPADGFEVYQPEFSAVWIRQLDPANYPNVQWETWSFPALTISTIAAMTNPGSSFAVLRKQGALNLHEYLQEAFSLKYYVEIGRQGERKYYAVYARPLLPYETPGTYAIKTPTPAPTAVNSKLKCSPADGVMEIPAPNLIYMLPYP